MRLFLIGSFLFLFAGCSAATPQVLPAPADAPDAGTPGSLQLEETVAAAVKARDLALWAHWTQGAPLNRATGNPALFTKTTLDTLRAAQHLPHADVRGLRNLEVYVAGEMLSTAVEDEDVAVFNLEASLTFTFEGREVPYRDLTRLLAGEKSDKRRRAMWSASLPAANRLDAMLRRRQAKVRSAVEAWGYTFDGFLALMRGEDLDTLAEGAERFLDLTDAPWRATLERLAHSKLKTTASKLTRADLPAITRVPPQEQRFPKNDIFPRAMEVLKGLGLQNLPGFYVEPSDDQKKNPLPLTVAPGGSSDVRLSFRPHGGLRDQAAMLLELGRALALKHCDQAIEHCRLGNPLLAETTAYTLASVTDEPAWLIEAGVADADLAEIRFNAKAYQLFRARRAAGLYLFQLSALDATDAEAQMMFAHTLSRALGIALSDEDATRWRVESEPLLRSISYLQALAYSRVLKQKIVEQVGATWWKNPQASTWLKREWALGTQPQPGSFGRAIEVLAAEMAQSP
ncbi:MAG: hypothetical protein K1X64_21680 [Myxococcaceae bacterium]|nr:hypothetical protein [Myxococcaceae bacterium]